MFNEKTIENSKEESIVEVKNLKKWFKIKRGITDVVAGKPQNYIKALNDVSFEVYKGENLGLVGESGCGKSTLAKTLIRLYEPTSGEIKINGVNIEKMKGEDLRKIRPSMQMIFQDPYSSLNPRMTVYEIIREMLTVHNIVEKQEINNRVKELLEMCGLGFEYAQRYPGEFSGGQRQRIGIARALSLQPRFIIADEPVSALDVSIQAQIINLLKELQERLGLTLLFISHDLRVVKHITHRVAVMYLGVLVELGDTESLFERPFHPYTKVLIKAAPVLDPTDRKREYAIEGDLPSPIDMPSGCKFHPRCVYCKDRCKIEEPKMIEIEKGRFVTCHFPINI